jgi:hypothetical protein
MIKNNGQRDFLKIKDASLLLPPETQQSQLGLKEMLKK